MVLKRKKKKAKKTLKKAVPKVKIEEQPIQKEVVFPVVKKQLFTIDLARSEWNVRVGEFKKTLILKDKIRSIQDRIEEDERYKARQ